MRTSKLLSVGTMVLLAAASVGAEEPMGNNLSYPTVYTAGVEDVYEWSPDHEPVGVGFNYSYGCDRPETVDQFNYPNTSCVDEGGSEPEFLSDVECVAPGQPCEDFTVDELDLVYWQKVEQQTWSAETTVAAPPIAAAYLDWSDNIESNTFSVTSVIRIETQPYFTSIVGFDPMIDTCSELDPCLTGLQMWHAAGHGTSELWGVRVDDGNPDDHAPYLYESPFATIHTNRARLNIAKLEMAEAECPVPGEDPVPPSIPALTWEVTLDPDGEIVEGWWVNPEPGGVDPCTLDDLEQTVELNVGGKWTYGYVWMTKRMEFDSCESGGFEVEGWWRLTFYTEDSSVDFAGQGQEYWENPEVLEPPPVVKVAALAEPESETDEGPMYPPVVDTTYNLTYIDICLTSKGGGGGGGHGHSSTP
jgi:hypothetical protein